MTQSNGSRRNVILDTNVLLHDPRAIDRFGKDTVIIPIYVIEEIDGFKRQLNELGRNARSVSRFLDEQRQKGNLGAGVELPDGGLLKVAMASKAMKSEVLSGHQADNLIMSVALETMEREPNKECVFVTMDTNLRIRADALGLKAVNYDADGVSLDSLYPGATVFNLERELIDKLYEKGEIEINFDLSEDESDAFLMPEDLLGDEDEDHPVYSNEYALLKDEANENHTALARLRPRKNLVTSLRPIRDGVWGIRPRNKEQHFGLDALLDDEIKLVTLLGKAGTGKTMLALAAGLQKTADEEVYGRLLVARPIFPLGRDLGYLPGSVEDKMNPWMQPIFDNVEFLMGLTQADKRSGRSYRELIDLGLLQIEPLTYIRGRSIPQQYMIVDEAQNLTPHEVKTIITRVGQGTKVVLTGDPYQIDNPYVDSESNGLTYVINKFKGQDIAATVTLTKGERSQLAELAANLL